jgi:hypothetical protein
MCAVSPSWALRRIRPTLNPIMQSQGILLPIDAVAQKEALR